MFTTGSAGITNTISTGSGWMNADWTWEARVYSTDTTLQVMPWFAGVDNANKIGLIQYLSDWWVSAPTGVNTGIAVPGNVWIAIAMQNAAGILQLYIDGTLKYSVSMPTIPISTGVQVIGNYINTAAFNGPWSGYIDEARLTIGVARLVDGYIPATAEFPNQ